MLEHYHMSFLFTTQNGNFLLYPIMFKKQILDKAEGFIPMLRTLSFKDSMTLS